MALVTRYFSPASAGTGDGTSWANRAALLTAGAWHSDIINFQFDVGTDGLRCITGPGTYNITQDLSASTLGSGTIPTVASPLSFEGCDSSGVLLDPPDPDWTSDQPAWDDSTLPVFSFGNAFMALSGGGTLLRLIKIVSTQANAAAAALGATSMDWCSLSWTSGGSTTSSGFTGPQVRLTNSQITVAVASYQAAMQVSSGYISNVRVIGVTGSSGNRVGVEYNGTTLALALNRVTCVGHGGHGFSSSSTNVGQQFFINRSIFANNGGDGMRFASTAAQTQHQRVNNSMITGNGGYGINPQGAARVVATTNRLRDNATANFNALGNYPTDRGNYTTDDSDANEYVDAATTKDFRIKSSASNIVGRYGVSDQASVVGTRVTAA